MGVDLGLYCEVCGEPATNSVRDYYKWDDWDSDMVKCKPHGDRHLFCDTHKRNSIETDISVSPLMYHKDMYDKL